MKNTDNKSSQKLLEAMEFISDETIENADKQNSSKPKKKGLLLKIGAVAACMAVVGGIAAIHLGGENGISSSTADSGRTSGGIASAEKLDDYSLATAEYPKMAQYPVNPNDNGAYKAWNEDKKALRAAYEAVDITEFYEKTLPQFLSGGENKLFSPANLYVALGMCAEISGGDTRNEILSLTGCDDINELRDISNAVWGGAYSDDGVITSHMASSVWLNNDIAYNDDTLLSLADNYYTSTYYGDPEDADYSSALRGWISQQTNGFLDSQISELEISKDSVMELVSTVYFKGRWGIEFNPENNTTASFHTKNGDVTAEFMNRSELQYYFWGEKFSAIEQRIGFDSSMVFILPDEEYSTDDILADSEAIEFLSQPYSYSWINSKYLIVNESIPKFDISYNTDLMEGLQSLGITSMFDFGTADFTPLTDTPDIAITKVSHGVRVAIDEEGVEAGAYIDMSLCGAGMPPDEEVDFILDRPFIFVIKSHTGCPMFVGVVCNPNE